MKTTPLSVLHTVADHYKSDARDFLDRFDILWEAQLHKTGRIKSFVDLLLSCECILKCHIVLGRTSDDPITIEYRNLASPGFAQWLKRSPSHPKKAQDQRATALRSTSVRP
jgi:hypothetical protein